MNKEELIRLLKECRAIQFGRFVLTSGAVSDYYIDIKKASTSPEILGKIAEAMAKYTEGYSPSRDGTRCCAPSCCIILRNKYPLCNH